MPVSTESQCREASVDVPVIKANRATFSVQAMCSVLGVAPSGYYEWLTHPISNRGPGGRPPPSPDPGVVHRKLRFTVVMTVDASRRNAAQIERREPSARACERRMDAQLLAPIAPRPDRPIAGTAPARSAVRGRNVRC
jgi:hypothetical protein